MPCSKFLVLTLTILLARQACGQDETGDWRFDLEGSYLYGSVNGYVQTPSGGEPGTTSNRRPTLDEIGISNTSIYDAQGIVAWRNEEFYLGGQFIQMSGSATLNDTLISHGQTFPAGAQVSSEVDLNWYRFGYRHRFVLGREKDWTLWPAIGAAVLDFQYKLHDSDTSADRGYVKPNAQFGLEAEWRPKRGPFSINLTLLGCPPISPPLPQIFFEQLTAGYRVLNHHGADLRIFGGVAFEQIYYEDNQQQPNQVQADFGPMFVVGLHFSF